MPLQTELPLEVPVDHYGRKTLDKLHSIHNGVLYSTPAYLIGKHYWRCTVYRHASYGAVTDWEWIRESDRLGYEGSCFWNTCHDWPTYNGDKCDGGMPKGLA